MDEIKYIRDGRAPIPTKESISRVMRANKAKGTKPELIIRKLLWNNGLRGYRLNWKKASGTPDICYPGKKFAIFINGCYWHRCPYCNPSYPKSNIAFWRNKFETNKSRDQKKQEDLENSGWKVLILWECQIKNNLFECLKRVKSFM